ncbi:MAG: ROK family protein, partial [Mesorhizobium sp.]
YLSLEARGRWNGNDAGWVAEVAPIFRNAIAVIENLFDPETIVLGGLASPQLLERLAALAEPLHNSVSARKDRAAPRILVAQGGQHAVLRGAAALAVSGVLSPRFGQIFTAKRQREGDLLNGGDIAA